MKYPKSFYQVFECHSDDMFDYDPSKVLFESDDLGQAHTLAYTKWKLSLREYHEVQALCEADFWRDKKLSARLDAIAAKIDKVYGPMITAMNRLAKEMA